MIPWLVDIALSSLSALFSLLALRNYLPIRGTQIGRYMCAITAALAVLSVVAAASFSLWMLHGHGPDVSFPSMALSSILLIASLVFFKLSKI